MTKEQIIKLAKEHLDVSAVDKEKLVKFALKVADIEYDRGFDDGWESRADAEKELKRSKKASNEEIFCLLPG